MRILLLHQYFLEKNDGGGSRFNEMTQVWSEAGHQVTVIAGMVHYATGLKAKHYKGKWTDRQKDFYPGVEVIRCHVSESYSKGFVGRFWAFISFTLSSIWAGLFKTGKGYDVIIATSPPLFIGLTAYVLSKIKGIPYIFELRDLWPESIIDMGILKNKLAINLSYKLEDFIYRKAIAINMLIPTFRKYLFEKRKVDPEKLMYIPNGADFSLSEKVLDSFNREIFRKEHGYDNAFVITYVGAHGPANHLIQLVQAAEKLQQTNVIFQLIGAGPQKEMLQNEVKNRDLSNVWFVNPVPKSEVYQYIAASDMGTSVLKKADIFLGVLSNKTFDYMSCKVPILILIDGLSRNLIEEANCGIYAEPENIDEIVSKIKFVMSEWNSTKLKAKGQNGYLYAKEHFDRTTLAKKYIAEIEEKLEN